MTLYAAYGSNMDPEQMLERAPHSPMAGTGWLYGWRLTFGGEDIGWEGALATLVEDVASRVFVVLYDVTKAAADAGREAVAEPVALAVPVKVVKGYEQPPVHGTQVESVVVYWFCVEHEDA